MDVILGIARYQSKIKESSHPLKPRQVNSPDHLPPFPGDTLDNTLIGNLVGQETGIKVDGVIDCLLRLDPERHSEVVSLIKGGDSIRRGHGKT